MADSTCGPSTALKSFSEHINRDHSLHHERAGSSRAQPANFRSTPVRNQSNEADVRAFTSQAAFPADLMGVMPDMNGHMHPAAFHQIGPHFGGPQARPAGPGGVPGHASSDWAAEYAVHPSAIPATTSSAAPQVHPAFRHQQPLQAVNQRLQHFSSGMMGPAPAFASMCPPSFANHTMQSGFSSMTSSYIPPAIHATATATSFPQELPLRTSDESSGVAGLTEAELEARFAQMESELEFQDEMDSWMQAHGPTTSKQSEAAQTETVDAILETLADDLAAQRLGEPTTAVAEPPENVEWREARRRDLDNLARTAGEIVETLNAQSNARFQQSSFLRLMRRIHTREVTVKDDDLVDETTGLPVGGIVENTIAETTTTTTTKTPNSGGTP
ncbi:hypothetical protein SEPCBS57363_000441 [Sporothrix epigloea]|uniref:Peroxin 20 n=1 Tax=Sporothrix epigloea TaxID=1892477 RepID=A0ABP0D5S5_9PEZI